MEQYIEISLADLLEMVSKGNFNDIYWKNSSNELVPVINVPFYLNQLGKKKWFKREVTE
ncbi:hypothetical protein [Bacillus mycoides]|uniref:hypothetical protein n=1 Tax=Bacillus mycoides TaxID=1405 RepID=UPI001C0230BA|nr:hypothetical protein [Bacillus mycoides]